MRACVCVPALLWKAREQSSLKTERNARNETTSKTGEVIHVKIMSGIACVSLKEFVFRCLNTKSDFLFSHSFSSDVCVCVFVSLSPSLANPSLRSLAASSLTRFPASRVPLFSSLFLNLDPERHSILPDFRCLQRITCSPVLLIPAVLLVCSFLNPL